MPLTSQLVGLRTSCGEETTVLEAKATVRRKWDCSNSSLYFEEVQQLKKKKSRKGGMLLEGMCNQQK